MVLEIEAEFQLYYTVPQERKYPKAPRIWRVAQRLDMSKSDPRPPFGGVRNSGYGCELSVSGIWEFVNIHSVWVNRI